MKTRHRTTLAAALTIACAGSIALVPRAACQEVYWPTHEWRRSTPEAQGMDSRILAQAFDYVRLHQIPIHSLLIVRNGYIVLDAYFWPFQDGQWHDLASVTKSVTSTLIGIAIGQHKIGAASQPLLPIFDQRPVANRDERKNRITIENLLTMTSGLDCHVEHGEITLSQMMGSANWIQFMLDLPMVAEPGSQFEYCSGGMHLLSGVIAQATGASTLDFARRELFAPLGITDVAWPLDPQGVPHGWGDLHLHPRDMAKLGLLWLNGGRWENRQVVPAEWMRAASQVHSHPNFGSGQYGYGLWVYPNRNPPIFEGLGRGGQRISVVPAKQLVVVFTGGEFEPGDIGEFIGRAIRSDQALPDDTAGAARLAAAIRDARQAPAPHPIPPVPVIAGRVSGNSYALEPNRIGLKALSVSFPAGAEASVHLEGSDLAAEQRPVGLDGVPRISPNGRFALPVAVMGAWESDSTFVLDYNEVGNINTFRFRLTFAGSDVTVDLTEKTGLVEAQVRGRSR